MPMYREGMDWFVLRVASNKENFVRDTLLQKKVQIEGLEERVGANHGAHREDPTLKGGKQRITETKLYPGYIFVEMRLEPDGRIPSGCLLPDQGNHRRGRLRGHGGATHPDVAQARWRRCSTTPRCPKRTPTVRMEFVLRATTSPSRKGPSRTTRAPWTRCCPRSGLVRVLVTIFGRQAPIELEYWQIAKAEE